MTREETIAIFKAFIENPLFSDEHKQAFNIAIHDIKQRHEWDINNLILVNKDNYESLEQELDNDMVSLGVFEQVMWERDVAIDQLKQLGYELGEKIRTDEDAISREDALKLIRDCGRCDDKTAYGTIYYGIENLPPVNPQSRIGHWITREVRQEEVPCCSECDSDCRDALAYGWDYCPNCGSYNGGR